MRSLPQLICPNCGFKGTVAYTGLRDHLFGAPGSWSMQHCDSPSCGAYWSDPAPHPEDLPRAYKGYYTHSGDEINLAPTFRRTLRDTFSKQKLGYPHESSGWIRATSLVVKLFPERREAALYSHFYLAWEGGGRLLEIGCGAGKQLEVLKRAGWDASGIDFDPAAAAAARARGLHVEIGDLRDIKYPDASFDAIVMAHVIEHVYDPVGLLTECQRILKPGGRLISITPNTGSLGHRLYRQAWRGLEPPRHIVIFNPQALRLAAECAGLKVDRVRVTARDAANLLLASSRIATVGDDVQIQRPESTQRPPIRLRLLAMIERIAGWFGLHWGEELVLMARK